jgi:signal transduction histidine kinase
MIDLKNRDRIRVPEEFPMRTAPDRDREKTGRATVSLALIGLRAAQCAWLGAATIDDDTKVLGVVQRPDSWLDSTARGLVGRKLCLGTSDCRCPFHEAARSGVPLRGRWPAEFAGSGLIGRVMIWPLAGTSAGHGLPAAVVIPQAKAGPRRSREGPAEPQLEAAAMLAHELRGPLSSLRGAGELALSSGSESGEEHQLLELMMRQIERLDRLTRTLLEAFRLEAGSLELSVEAVDIAELCEDVIADFETPSGTEIDLLRDPSPGKVFLDQAKVRTILANLIGNAVKHSPVGGRVLVKVETDLDGIRLSVEDEGAGIEEQHLPHIFDAFYQSAEERRTKRGFGLGLHIVRTLVESHGGRIWVEPAAGHGACLAFAIPARRQRAPSRGLKGSREPVDSADRGDQPSDTIVAISSRLPRSKAE